MKLLDKLCEHGIKLKITIGHILQPWEIKRKDAVKDLVKQKSSKVKKMLDKLFKPVKKEEE